MSAFYNYLPGSFRDVPFLYVDSDGEIGRRVAVYEYPGRDIPTVEDMGRKARSWTMDIMVAGPKYMMERNALIKALEEKGPGVLVHPTLGERTVCVISARGPVESTREGGTARFSVTFVEAGDQKSPGHAIDYRAVVSDRSDTVDAAAAEQMAGKMDTGAPEWSLSDLADQATALASAVKNGISKISEIVSNSDIMTAITDLSAAASDLIRAPMDLYGAVQDIFNDIVTAVTNPLDAFNALRAFFDFAGTGDAIPTTTPDRVTQKANTEALTYAMRCAATVAATRAASFAEYASQAEADTVRDIVAEALDTLSMTAGNALYGALVDLRAAVLQDLSTRPGLPGIVALTLPEDTPALVLAHRLYGDASRADEIVARNGISNPCFIPGGRALEVLDV